MMKWLRHRRYNRAEVIRLRRLVAEQQELIDEYRGREFYFRACLRDGRINAREFRHRVGQVVGELIG